ncbi:MAG: DUF4340 domain-containing protein [Kiritimatiellia bacterium]
MIAVGRTLARWALLIVLAALALVLLSHKETARLQGSSPKLCRLDFDLVERLAVTTGEETVAVERSDGLWRLTAPYRTTADQRASRRLLDALESARIRDVIEPSDLAARGLNRSNFGLDPPRAVVNMAYADEEDGSTILLGDATPSSNGVYAASSDSEAVFVVGNQLLQFLPTSETDWRARGFLEGCNPLFTTLELRKPGHSYLRLAQSNGVWRVVQPTLRALDTRLVDALVSAAFNCRAERFLWPDGNHTGRLTAPQLAEYGLAGDQTLTLEMTAANKPTQPYRLTIGKRHESGGHYALYANDGAVVILPEAAVQSLADTADRLSAQARFFAESPENIREIKVTPAHGNDFILTRTGTSWRFTLPDLGAADADRIHTLLQGLSALRPQPSTHTTNTIPNPPAANLLLTGQGTPLELAVTPIGTPPTHALIRYGAPDTPPYETAWTNLPPEIRQGCAPLLFADRTILSIPAEHLRGIIVRGEDIGCITTRLPVVDGVWTSPSGEIDPTVLADWSRLLVRLQADRVLAADAQEPPKEMGFQPPWRELVITLSSADSPRRTLQIGATAEHGRYARILGREVIYTLPQTTIETLSRRPVREK